MLWGRPFGGSETPENATARGGSRVFAYLGVSMEAHNCCTVVKFRVSEAPTCRAVVILGRVGRGARKYCRDWRQQDFRLFGVEHGGAKLLYCLQFGTVRGQYGSAKLLYCLQFGWSETPKCCVVVNFRGPRRQKVLPREAAAGSSLIWRSVWRRGQYERAKMLCCRQVGWSEAPKYCTVVSFMGPETPENATAGGGSRTFAYLGVNTEAHC